jgi:septum site-determining protein MinC
VHALAFVTAWHRFMLPENNGDHMATEENAHKGVSEAHKPHTRQGGQGMEEKPSVQAYIAIKGTRNGLLLTLEPDTPFSELLNALAGRLAEAPTFFRGASLSVDTSRRALRVSERTQLENLLAYYQMSIQPFEQGTERQGKAQAAGLKEARTTIELPPTEVSTEAKYSTSDSEELAHNQRSLRESDDTLFLRRTIRSGQAIHHSSNIVVLGDVNPGAEIVAGGDILVWGVLRGMVHAGYPDNEQALVCSLLLSPVQLRIAHLLSRPPEGFEAQPRPEIAMIKNGQIVVETWVQGRPSRK